MKLGISHYCVRANDREVHYPKELERPRPQGNIAEEAFEHLRFTAKYGTDRTSHQENGRSYFAHPEEYEIWLHCGAPGLFLDELEAYVRGERLEIPSH